MRLIAGLIVLLTCAACTIGPTQPQSSTTEAPTTAAAAPTTEAPRPTPTELPVLASRTTSYSSASATVAVNQLVVSGGVSTLTWTLTNTSDDGLIVTTGSRPSEIRCSSSRPFMCGIFRSDSTK